MTKKLYLSNSQINTFTDCNRKWHIDKVQRIRPTYLSSPLYFGTLIDDTLEHYLINKDGKHLETFYKCLNNFEVNGSAKVLPKDLLALRINVGDLDDKLINQSDVDDYCSSKDLESVQVKEFLDYCKSKRKRKSPLDMTEQSIFNFMGYKSLEAKGLLMIEKLIEWVDEHVEEVISTQKKIDITNGNGDKFIGYLDFVVRLKSGKTVLIDLKTSSDPNKYYPEDAANTSRQLGIYSQEEKIKDVAYLVVDKKIRKREPRVRLKYVEGIITEEWLDEVFDEIEKVTEQIKEKLPLGESAFEKNLDSCHNYGNCQYRGLCEKGSMSGLEKIK